MAGSGLPGVATTQRYTTGRAHATALSDTGEFVCETTGVAFSCAALTAPVPSVSGVNLAAAYPACGAPTLGDLCIVNNLVAR